MTVQASVVPSHEATRQLCNYKMQVYGPESSGKKTTLALLSEVSDMSSIAPATAICLSGLYTQIKCTLDGHTTGNAEGNYLSVFVLLNLKGHHSAGWIPRVMHLPEKWLVLFRTGSACS